MLFQLILFRHIYNLNKVIFTVKIGVLVHMHCGHVVSAFFVSGVTNVDPRRRSGAIQGIKSDVRAGRLGMFRYVPTGNRRLKRTSNRINPDRSGLFEISQDWSGINVWNEVGTGRAEAQMLKKASSLLATNWEICLYQGLHVFFSSQRCFRRSRAAPCWEVKKDQNDGARHTEAEI